MPGFNRKSSEGQGLQTERKQRRCHQKFGTIQDLDLQSLQMETSCQNNSSKKGSKKRENCCHEKRSGNFNA